MAPKILVFAGSIRTGAWSGRTADAAMKELALQGAEVTRISLADYPLPIMDEDLEAQKGIPENAVKLARLIAHHDGVLVATPEYNGSISSVLKNAIDWASRPWGKNSFSRMPSGVIGTSPGSIGTAVAQQSLKSVLSFCNSPMMNALEAYVQFTPGLITDDGEVTKPDTEMFLKNYMNEYHIFFRRVLSVLPRSN